MSTRQFFPLVGLAIRQNFGRQRLQRELEPSQVMGEVEQVEGYLAAGRTTLDLIYCLAAELIHLAMPHASHASILDLGCGTGVFIARLVGALTPKDICGLDASPEMLAVAENVLRSCGFSGEVRLDVGDITCLDGFRSSSYDLVTCSLTAHHLDNVNPRVATLLREMDRIATPEGVVFLVDLARLKKRSYVERYVRIFAPGQSDRHNVDFLNSMLAAFTPDELRSVVPDETSAGLWLHFTSPMLPTLQVVMRVPNSRPSLAKPLWHDSPTPMAGNSEWRSLRNLFRKRCLAAWQKVESRQSGTG